MQFGQVGTPPEHTPIGRNRLIGLAERLEGVAEIGLGLKKIRAQLRAAR